MALMSCPHCSQSISDRAEACPHCRTSLVVLATVAPHSRADTATPPQRLVAPFAWMNRHPWLTAYAAIGVFSLPLLAYLATRPFDEYSEAVLAGYGSLLGITSLWGGIWLAMPGMTRRQKWRSVAVHLGILLAIVTTLWLLIASPVFRYIAVAIAVGGAGYGIYRLIRADASKPSSHYRWRIHAGYVVVFIGAMGLPAIDSATTTSTKHSLRPALPQQRDTRRFPLGGLVIIYAGLKLVEHFSRKAGHAETESSQAMYVSLPKLMLDHSAPAATESEAKSKIL